MPIYEYRCTACSHKFERLQGIDEPDPELCPACEQPDVKRLISASSFVLKGSGWYRDHYGLRPDASGASGSSSESDTADSASSSGESAAASKSDAASGGSSSSGDTSSD